MSVGSLVTPTPTHEYNGRTLNALSRTAIGGRREQSRADVERQRDLSVWCLSDETAGMDGWMAVAFDINQQQLNGQWIREQNAIDQHDNSLNTNKHRITTSFNF